MVPHSAHYLQYRVYIYVHMYVLIIDEVLYVTQYIPKIVHVMLSNVPSAVTSCSSTLSLWTSCHKPEALEVWAEAVTGMNRMPITTDCVVITVWSWTPSHVTTPTTSPHLSSLFYGWQLHFAHWSTNFSTDAPRYRSTQTVFNQKLSPTSVHTTYPYYNTPSPTTVASLTLTF